MNKRTAFTLIELLIVVAIVTALAALLLPAVQAARANATRGDCQNRLRNVGLALLQHHDVYREFPPGNVVVDEGICRAWGIAGRDYPSKDGANWAIHLLPFLEEQPLHAAYDFSTFNEAEVNGDVTGAAVAIYACPADQETQVRLAPGGGPAATAALNVAYMPGSYRGVSGASEGVYFLDSSELGNYKAERRGVLHAVGARGYRPESLSTIIDGASHTLAIGESTTRTKPSQRTFWAYSYAYFSLSAVTPQSRTLVGDYEACVAEGGYGGPSACQRGWGSFHPNIVNFVACDGAIRAIATDVDMDLLSRMATIAGAEHAVAP